MIENYKFKEGKDETFLPKFREMKITSEEGSFQCSVGSPSSLPNKMNTESFISHPSLLQSLLSNTCKSQRLDILFQS